MNTVSKLVCGLMLSVALYGCSNQSAVPPIHGGKLSAQARRGNAIITINGNLLPIGSLYGLYSEDDVVLEAAGATNNVVWKILPHNVGELYKMKGGVRTSCVKEVLPLGSPSVPACILEGHITTEEIHYKAARGSSFPLFHVLPKVNPRDEINMFSLNVNSNTLPTVILFSATPTEGVYPLLTKLSFSFNDEDYDLRFTERIECNLDYGDGEPSEVIRDCTPDTTGILGGKPMLYTFSHTYKTPGTYTAKLRVTDRSGRPVVQNLLIKVNS
ncbi:MAG: PKD domain-containing protein [Deinococcaceae bacterium]